MNKHFTTLMFASIMAFQAGAVVDKNFDYHVDRFADIEVLRYEVPEFDQLSLNQKKMIYYLSQAAQSGRDIIWDQNGRYNLQIRKLLENIYTNYKGDKNSPEFKAFDNTSSKYGLAMAYITTIPLTNLRLNFQRHFSKSK